MRGTLLVFAALAALFSDASFAVPTVYGYAGTPFTVFEEIDTGVAGEYTTSMSLTGSITLAGPLAPDATTDLTVGGPAALSWSFSDGQVTYSNLNQDPDTRLTFIFSTDAGGAIADWQLSLDRRDAGLPGGAEFARIVSLGPAACAGAVCDSAQIGTSAGIDLASGGVAATGSWSVTPVPEPGSYALMAAGLVFIGVAARRASLRARPTPSACSERGSRSRQHRQRMPQ